jgi:hypothetical protein
MDWYSCVCADRLFGIRLLGQVQINLQPQLIIKIKREPWYST